MNLKEKNMLAHYKELIENRLFDEYDIHSFLIFIRRHIPTDNFNLIHEISDTIAHTEKDRGIIHDNIEKCINTNYKKEGGRGIIGYNGCPIESWNKEWKKLMDYFNILVDELILKEITLCIYSLLQDIEYVTKDKADNKIGKLRLIINPEYSEILLCTTENHPYSFLVCFTKLADIDLNQTFNEFIKCKPSETFREQGILKLRNEKGIVCEIK